MLIEEECMAENQHLLQKVFIRDVLTHAEYNKENWKKDDWYQ
jgi:mRNA-degrading endonuclease HigB of HigAB toxin-antitoxin module